MKTRREWIRERRRKKGGKLRKVVIGFSVVISLAITAGVVYWVIGRLDHGITEQDGMVKDAALICEAESTEILTDLPKEDESVEEQSSEPVKEEEPEPEGYSLERWKKEHTHVKGIYVTGPVAGSARMSGLIELLDETELNAMVIDIKNDGGEITFKMPEDSDPAIKGNCVRYIGDIGSLMTELKNHGIYTIARIVCFKDPLLAAARPELALKDTNGKLITDSNNLAWVNPCNEDVWNYLTDIAVYCADLGFDEIQFDYVRFPVGKGTENADYGVEVTEDNKHEYIQRFLQCAAERLHEKNIPVTADLFGTVIGNPVDVRRVGQDYAELASTVDVLCPMIYPSHYGKGVFGLDVPDAKPYETIVGALGRSVEELSEVEEKECAIVRPWLQDFTATWVDGHISYGVEEVRLQIQAVYDSGYDEWILWNAKNNYSITNE